ncbi:MAG: hypothetical protein RR945_03195 [Erysipelotrichaceae bacterium]
MVNAIDLNKTYKENLDILIKEQGIETVFANLYAIFISHEDTIQSRNNIMKVIKHQSV